MKTSNIDHCRETLYKRMGIYEKDTRTSREINIEIKQMISALQDIISLAKPRLIMGGIRYGSNWNHKDLMNYMQSKFNIYKETGNMEMLIDFINFIAIESVLQTHSKYYFNSIDRKE